MILDIAARRAALTPRRQAVFAGGRWLDYGELNERTEALAGALAAEGIGKGDRVSIIAHNHLAHIELLLASAKTGAIYTPFNHRLSDVEQAELGEYVEPALILHDEENAEKALAAARGVSRLRSLDNYEEWLAGSPGAPPAPELGPEDTQMILFTGGTTGVPKGAMLPYRQGFYNAVNTILSWGLREDDTVIQATPSFHAALNALTVPLLHLGARVVVQRSFDASEYLRLVDDLGATILFLVPTMYAMLTRDPAFAGTGFQSVRWAISGGAPCPDAVREAFEGRGIRFRQGYGLTEAGVNCFTIELADAQEHPLSVGKPMLHAEAVIRERDGRPVAAGEVGELTLRGPHVFSGYFRRPEATAEVLRDGWLWTGDLARQDEQGNFYLVGRRKEMFISGGENVYPSEIENILTSHPLVAECAVVGVPDERWGEVGLAAVVPSKGGALVAEPELIDELTEYLRGRLARYKVPKCFVLLGELPKSGAGKVLKRELVQLAQEQL